MRKLGFILLGTVLSSGSHLVLAQPATDAALAAKSEAMIEPFVDADQFSGSVLVAKNGVPVLRKAFGLANREWDIKNTPDTKFRIGSITKQFTATAILQLVEAGKLSIDDPVSKYYAESPTAWNAITIRQLLTHTSGIPSFTGIPHFFEEQARLDRTPEEIIKLTQDKPLDFAPGSKYSYDNTGYVILGYIIEKVSGERYADYIQHHIFDPLGMKASGYDVSATIIPKRASGYSRDKDHYANARFISMTEPYAAGSLYTTVDDMLTWDQAIYAAKLLTPASLQAMFTDHGHGYGFGWVIDEQYGHPHYVHAGGVNGFITRFDRFPEDKLTVVVFSNEDSAVVPLVRIADGLAAIYLGIPPRTAEGEALLKRTIEELRSGTPDYDQMTPRMADGVRARVASLKETIGGLDNVKSVKLLGTGHRGVDRYQVAFQNGATEWEIKVGDDGKLTVADFSRMH
jgi:CubicO group peptidase (beta-lactamase class C family)